MNQNAWHCLTLQEFFGNFNWQGSQHWGKIDDDFSDHPRVPEISLSLSVQEFFGNFNWQGKPLKLLSHAHLSQTSFSLTLRVNQFFKFINWQGNPTIAGPVSTKSSEKTMTFSSPEINLTDLSDLF